MSLRVWLPMNRDLKNQGLDDVTVTNNGATFNSAGKLGGCYYFNGSSTIIFPSYDTTRSIAFWIKSPKTNSTIAFVDYKSKLGFGFQSNGYIIPNCADSSLKMYTADNFIANEWNHIVVTRDDNFTDVTLYINGALQTSRTSGNNNWTNNVDNCYIGGRSTGTNMTCYINDFRVYDHTLSQMEVKELSKGLILHYPLSDEYIESTTNLVTTEDGLSNTCYNGATGKYGYGTNTDMYKTLGVFEGRKSTKVYMGTAGLSAYPYVYFDNFNASGTTIQTLSFDYYPTVQDTLIPYSYNGSYNFSYTTDKTSGSASNVGQITVPVEVGRWNHITVTAQKADTTNTSRGIGYIRIGSTSHTSTTSNYWLFGNVQVEAKDHATGYAGVGGTRNSTIVYDCSGFCNNGTISGALTISNDTPKYRVSTTINSSKIQCITNPITGDDPIFSIGFWFKLKSNISYIAYADLVSFSSSSYSNQPFRLEICGNPVGNDIYWFRGPSGNTGGFKINTSNLVRDTWYYTMLVSEGNKQYSYYINGIKTGTYNGSANSWIPTNIFSIGDGQAGAFDISDVRIYATALSADDVKSLYQNSAYIDSSGNVYGAVHSEV